MAVFKGDDQPDSEQNINKAPDGKYIACRCEGYVQPILNFRSGLVVNRQNIGQSIRRNHKQIGDEHDDPLFHLKNSSFGVIVDYTRFT